MKSARSLIPIGTATLLPDTAQRVRRLEDQILAHLLNWGYREIIPPTFEYLDVLSVGLAPEVLEKCYKFADWSTGRILVLRPDVTAQIARIVAMGMGGIGLPLRLCYRTTVFRYEPEHAGREREVFQVGIELVGLDDPYSDAEVLTLLVESLKKVGLPEFKISLGHVGFYKALLNRLGLSEEKRKQAEIAAARKDLPLLERILSRERLSKKDARTILEVPERYGREEVLEWGRTVAGRDPTLTRPLDRLAQVYRLLELTGVQDHILIDLGEFRGFDYYDGVVFDVFTNSLGSELGGGGRYNHLIGRFGRDLPSTGFAFDVDRVFAALEPSALRLKESQETILVVAPAGQFSLAFKLAQYLRGEGIQVIHETAHVSRAQMVKYVGERANNRGIRTIVVLHSPGLTEEQVLVVRISTASNRIQMTKTALKDLAAAFKKRAYANI